MEAVLNIDALQITLSFARFELKNFPVPSVFGEFDKHV